MIISIIIPVYNTKEYLRKCVESLVACDLTDCEVLLVDDGSTDGESPALCDTLAAEYPAVRVIHQQNMGQGGARNTGIEATTGRYLFFVDSDDSVVPGTVEFLKKEIARTDADIIAFDFYSDDEISPRVRMNASLYYSDLPFTLKEHPEYMRSLPSPWSRIWKRSLFTENGITFPERVWYEDLRASVKLFALAESVVATHEPLYVYLQREGSTMHSAKLDRNREIIEAFEDLLGWYRERGLYETYAAELERLCIEHVYLAASVRVLCGDRKHPLLKEFAAYLKEQFPNYKKADLSFLPAARRLVFRLLELRLYGLIALLFKIKK